MSQTIKFKIIKDTGNHINNLITYNQDKQKNIGGYMQQLQSKSRA